MLNISHNQVNKKVSLDSFESGRLVSGSKYYKYINRFLLIFSVILLIVLFLVIALGLYFGSRLIVFWRNQLWRWKLEKEEYNKKKLREAEEEFIESTRIIDETLASRPQRDD